MAELTPFEHLDQLLDTCADTLRDIAAKSGDLDSVEEVQALLTSFNTNVAPAVLEASEGLLAMLAMLDRRPAA